MEEKNTIARLSPEIEALLEQLREKITKLDVASSGGSAIANRVLLEIGERTGNLATLALQGRDNGLPAVEKMRKILQEIVSVPIGNQDEAIGLKDEHAIVIKKYIDGIGQESSGSEIANNAGGEQRKLRLDLGGKGIVIITVYISGPTILAWKLDRQKTEKESQDLKGWLDRIFEERSREITLNASETANFLRTFRIKDASRNNDERDIATPRAFATVVLADKKRVSVTFSANRASDEYLAEWKKPE